MLGETTFTRDKPEIQQQQWHTLPTTSTCTDLDTVTDMDTASHHTMPNRGHTASQLQLVATASNMALPSSLVELMLAVMVHNNNSKEDQVQAALDLLLEDLE
jgi:hypothetical protein